MRAALLRAQAPVERSPLALEEVPDPAPRPGELRLRVRACAACRTDLHVVEGDLAPRTLPLIPGHQIVGVVDALGPGATRFAPGARVGVAWLRSTCGRCRHCERGRENLCAESSYTGWTHHGGFAAMACAPEAWAYALPDAFGDAEAAPLLCAGIIGYRALRRCRIEPGGALALYGFGSSAHVTLQVARHRGCRVWVRTRSARHRALALELGAEWAGAPGAAMPGPADAGIVFAPAGDVVPAALRDLDRGATLALAGIHMSELPTMSYAEHLFGERDLVSVTANTRADGEALLAEAVAIPLRPRITTYPLEHVNEMLRALRADAVEGTAVLVP